MPEDQSIHDIPAGQRVLMLENMASSPAFALLTDKWNQTVLETLDARIFAVETDDQETRLLKRVRAELTGTHHPRKMLETLIRSATAAARKPKPSVK